MHLACPGPESIISIWRAEIITLPEGLEWREPGRVILCKVPGPCTVRH